MRALGQHHAVEMFHGIFGRRRLAEIVPDRRERGAHLVEVCARPHGHETSP
jgi:hypothetical protein